jgi:SAM-dependent methyltransferase
MDDDDDDDDDDDIGEASEWATTKKKKKTKPLKISSARRMLLESFRVLRPGGFYVCVTYGAPNDRMEYFLDPDLRWDLTAHREVLKNTTKYHFFAFRKTGGKDPVLDGARLDPAAVIDATSLEVIRIGNSTATIPVLRDPFHGSSLDMRVRRHKR